MMDCMWISVVVDFWGEPFGELGYRIVNALLALWDEEAARQCEVYKDFAEPYQT